MLYEIENTDITSRFQFVVSSGSSFKTKTADSLSTTESVDKNDQLKRTQSQLEMQIQQKFHPDESQHHVADHGREFVEHRIQNRESS